MVIRSGDPFTGAFMVYADAYHFLSRHNIYYFRAIVPDGIRDGLHKWEYRKSLQTRNLQEAVIVIGNCGSAIHGLYGNLHPILVKVNNLLNGIQLPVN